MHSLKTVARRVAVFGIASAMCISSALATTATVNTSVLRLRAEPTTDSTVLGNILQGSTVLVLEDIATGWYKVSYNNVQGYMSGEYLTIVSTATYYGQVNTGGSVLNLRTGAGTEYSRAGTIPDGTVLSLSAPVNGWYYVTYNGTSGYVSAQYLTLMDEATAVAAIQAAEAAAAEAAAAAAATVTSVGSQIAAYAQNYLGCAYVYGASGPYSFDCSGFTSYIYKQFGYSIAHGASSQLAYGISVSMSELQPGDLVFFRYNTSYPASHVGIYIGDGKFIHASTNAYVVRIDTLTSGHYANCFVGGRRIVS